jgi:hypothetical protein
MVSLGSRFALSDGAVQARRNPVVRQSQACQPLRARPAIECLTQETENSMPATQESKARTRAFARVMGPFLVIVPGTVMVRAPDMGTALTDFFDNAALVWITGGLLLFSGLLIIAQHQYWSSLAAVLISLFGWYLALRGLVLLAAPQLIERAAGAAMNMMPIVRIGYGLVFLIGLWLTFAGWIARPT